jgi:hypothetical protein
MTYWCQACRRDLDRGDRACPHCGAARPLLGWRKKPPRLVVADELSERTREFLATVDQTGRLPELDVTNLHLEPREFAVLHNPASAMYEVRAHRQGGWAGTRISVGRVPLYVGGFQSAPVDALDLVATGDLYLTNQRLVFASATRTVVVPWKALVSVSGDLAVLRVASTRMRTPVAWTTPNPMLWAMLVQWLSVLRPETPRLPAGTQLAVNVRDEPDGRRTLVLTHGHQAPPSPHPAHGEHT